MGRKEELEKTIKTAESELRILEDREYSIERVDYWIHQAWTAGVPEEEISGILDIVYHPEHYNDPA